MQRLVAVGPRHGDEVLDAARYRRPRLVNDAERGVTVLHRGRDDAQRDEVVNLIEIDLLGVELEPDAVEALDAAVDADDRHLRLAQLVANVGGQLLDHALGRLALGFDLAAQRLEGGRLEIAERQLFELVLNAAHAQAIGNRRVDVEGLLRNARALVVGHVLQRAHVVQAVGELHEDDADVIHHRQQHLAEILGLPFLGRRKRDGADFGHALDDVGDVLAELLANFFRGGQGVLDHVMEQASGNADRVKLHVGQDVRHFQRVDEVGLPRMANLSLVLQGRENVGPAEQLKIGVRAVAPDLVEQILEANHEVRCLMAYRLLVVRLKPAATFRDSPALGRRLHVASAFRRTMTHHRARLGPWLRGVWNRSYTFGPCDLDVFYRDLQGEF